MRSNTTDFIFGVIATFILGFVFTLGYVIGRLGVANDCEAIGLIHISETVYECGVKK